LRPAIAGIFNVNSVDAGTANFINTDNDLAAEKPIWGVAGWSKDGKSVLLNDKYDVWSQPLDGSKGTDLTAGAGAAQQVQLRLTRFGVAGGGRGGRGGGGGGDEGVDLSQPQTFTAYGDLTKKSGYWRTAAGGGKPAPLAVVSGANPGHTSLVLSNKLQPKTIGEILQKPLRIAVSSLSSVHLAFFRGYLVTEKKLDLKNIAWRFLGEAFAS